jgi:uncharacterized protein
MAGNYVFRLREPRDDVLVGVALRDDGGALLKTFFRAARHTLSDRVIAGLLVSLPLVTAKVVLAIHFEALVLWLKGVPLTVRPQAESYGVTHVAASIKTGRGRG